MYVSRMGIAVLLLTLAWSASAHAAIRRGVAAPEISGTTLDGGQQLSLSDLRGKWVFVDFWASWCGPCMRELPNVVRLHNDHANDPNFAVLGVSLDSSGTLSQLKKAVAKNGVTYPVVYCTDGCNLIASDWGVRSIPSMFLIDPEGNIAGSDIDVSQVSSLIQEGGAPSRGGSDPRFGKQTSKAPQHDTVPAQPPTQFTSSYGSQSTQVQCTHQLMPAASGLPGAYDLQISMALTPGLPRLNKYRLFLRATKKTRDGRQVNAKWCFDINLLLDPKNRRAPYYLEIKDSSDPAKELGYKAPEVTAEIDLQHGVCQFMVPLEPDTQKLNYAVALYGDPAQTGR